MPQVVADPVCESYLPADGPWKEAFGLVLTALNPFPSPLLEAFESFRETFESSLRKAGVSEKNSLLYSPTALHCTVASLHPFFAPRPKSEKELISAWSQIISSSLAGDKSISSAGREVRVSEVKVFDDGVCVILFDDCDHQIERIRASLRKMHGSGIGVSWERFRVPNICHSTILRWRATPKMTTDELQVIVDHAARKSGIVGMKIDITNVQILNEKTAYMQKYVCCKMLRLDGSDEQ